VSLRAQTALALGVMLLAALAVLFAVVGPMLSGTFARLEVTEVREHVARVLNAIDAELASMRSTAGDWAAWNDTYEYVGGELPSFYEDNMMPSSLVRLRLNLVLLSGLDGEPIAFTAVDLERGEEVEAPVELLSAPYVSSLFPELVGGETALTSGLLRLNDGLLLVAAHAILTSEDEGPSRGVLIIGRFLGPAEVQRLAEQTHLIVTVRGLDDPRFDVSILDRLIDGAGESEDIVVHPTSGESIAGHTLLRDLRGEPVGIASIETTRDTYQAGQASLRYLGGTAIGTLVFAAVLLLLLLDRRVLARMSVLAKGVAEITAQNAPSGRVAASGRDEIAQLATGMNEMLETLEESRQKLQRSERQYRNLFEYSRDAIYITTPEGRFIDANHALVDLLGCPRKELMQRDAASFYRDPKARDRFKAAISGPGFVVDYPVQLKRYDGTVLDCLLTTVVQTTPDGEVSVYQGIIRDVTELKRQQAELSYLAMHDPLTGLLNRVALEDRLSLELAHASRNLERCGVMYVDLDRFKEVNDTQGHAVGDEILRQIAGRLVAVLRKSDSVGRIGGDEFVVVIPDMEELSDGGNVAEKLLRILEEPFVSPGQPVTLSASIGIAIYPDDAEEGKLLIQYADAAMYVAKQQGRGTWHKYGSDDADA
jgi:diguanylate cyclase (GGDEF)-like protein/PAS domain S-box-containing protein